MQEIKKNVAVVKGNFPLRPGAKSQRRKEVRLSFLRQSYKSKSSLPSFVIGGLYGKDVRAVLLEGNSPSYVRYMKVVRILSVFTASLGESDHSEVQLEDSGSVTLKSRKSIRTLDLVSCFFPDDEETMQLRELRRVYPHYEWLGLMNSYVDMETGHFASNWTSYEGISHPVFNSYVEALRYFLNLPMFAGTLAGRLGNSLGSYFTFSEEVVGESTSRLTVSDPNGAFRERAFVGTVGRNALKALTYICSSFVLRDGQMHRNYLSFEESHLMVVEVGSVNQDSTLIIDRQPSFSIGDLKDLYNRGHCVTQDDIAIKICSPGSLMVRPLPLVFPGQSLKSVYYSLQRLARHPRLRTPTATWLFCSLRVLRYFEIYLTGGQCVHDTTCVCDLRVSGIHEMTSDYERNYHGSCFAQKVFSALIDLSLSFECRDDELRRSSSVSSLSLFDQWAKVRQGGSGIEEVKSQLREGYARLIRDMTC